MKKRHLTLVGNKPRSTPPPSVEDQLREQIGILENKITRISIELGFANDRHAAGSLALDQTRKLVVDSIARAEKAEKRIAQIMRSHRGNSRFGERVRNMMTNTDVAVRDTRPPMVVLRDRFETRRTELKAALGNDIPVDAFIRAVMTSVALNPDILACSWQSIWNACLRACRDGLVPDGQDAAIVPYKTSAQYIPMYSGLLRRFRRSGQFKWITANVVREGEEFIHYIDETGEHFRHVPGGNFTAQIVKIYSLATTKDGGVFVAVMPIAEANKIRNMSRTTRDDAPWKQWPEEMYKKTALRRLSKYLPSARDLLPDEEIEAPAIAAELPAPEATPANPSSITTAGAAGGEQESRAGRDDATEEASASAARPVGDLAAVSPEELAAAAYERGQEAKTAGVQRRALPPEYRAAARSREAISWQAGWDGASMPTFGEGT